VVVDIKTARITI